jgi:hypothetical protein|tara:strand:+ start:1373 stop:2080 length:708 start_codon:yes stop_codon:yes gene_type:complete
MNKTIFFLVKIFDNESYADDFIRGNIFANRLSYFRKLEEGESSNRSDQHEGVVSWHQPEQVNVEINGRLITDLAGPISVKMNWHNHLNIFCIYAAHSGEFEGVSEDNLDAFKKELEIPDECLKLGEYVVLITSVSQFIKRVTESAKCHNYGLTAGLVEYYDPKTFHGTFSETESIFRKRDEYQHQKEYRLVFNSGFQGDAPLILSIGDISDITMKCKVADINRYLDIKLPENSSS